MLFFYKKNGLLVSNTLIKCSLSNSANSPLGAFHIKSGEEMMAAPCLNGFGSGAKLRSINKIKRCETCNLESRLNASHCQRHGL